ncbi:MAG TPA: hypothetical protein VEA38_16580 [Terriglobales bacterium]|nr:hypothetical protein [Terriglobales bacterium]
MNPDALIGYVGGFLVAALTLALWGAVCLALDNADLRRLIRAEQGYSAYADARMEKAERAAADARIERDEARMRYAGAIRVAEVAAAERDRARASASRLLAANRELARRLRARRSRSTKPTPARRTR